MTTPNQTHTFKELYDNYNAYTKEYEETKQLLLICMNDDLVVQAKECRLKMKDLMDKIDVITHSVLVQS